MLSSVVKWASLDYEARQGRPPARIVLHLDVSGTLILSDVAGKKTLAEGFAKASDHSRSSNPLLTFSLDLDCGEPPQGAPKLLSHVEAGRLELPAHLMEAVRQGLDAPGDVPALFEEAYNRVSTCARPSQRARPPLAAPASPACQKRCLGELPPLPPVAATCCGV